MNLRVSVSKPVMLIGSPRGRLHAVGLCAFTSARQKKHGMDGLSCINTAPPLLSVCEFPLFRRFMFRISASSTESAVSVCTVQTLYDDGGEQEIEKHCVRRRV